MLGAFSFVFICFGELKMDCVHTPDDECENCRKPSVLAVDASLLTSAETAKALSKIDMIIAVTGLAHSYRLCQSIETLNIGVPLLNIKLPRRDESWQSPKFDKYKNNRGSIKSKGRR